MLNMSNTNFSFNGTSIRESDNATLANMNASYWGAGINFSLNIDDISKDDPQIIADFSEFKTKVMATIADLHD